MRLSFCILCAFFHLKLLPRQRLKCRSMVTPIVLWHVHLMLWQLISIRINPLISTNATAGVSTFNGALMSKCCFSGFSSWFAIRSSRPAEGHLMISDIVSTTRSFLQGDVQTVCIHRKKHVVVIETAILRQSICHSRAKHAKLSRFFWQDPCGATMPLIAL